MRAERLPTDQMLAAANWVRQVIDKPWRAGAQGPDAYFCYGLARATAKELGGYDLPIINADPNDLRAVIRLVKDHPLRNLWTQVSVPRHLDIVLLSHAQHEHHIGTWLALDDGVVLHAVEQFNADGSTSETKPAVSADNLMVLRTQGWMKFTFWRRPEVTA